MAEVAFEGVTKRFGATTAVADLNLTIADGEFIVLLGPTGAGKTTTLRLVAGLERADQGHIRIAGRDVSKLDPAERDIAFVFQQYSLYPHLTVFDNLAFPLRSPARRMSDAEVKARVLPIAETLRISAKLDRNVTKLSGGEMQRVAIGRALVRQPAIYLMDEPLSSLDAKLRAELRVELKRIQRDLGATMLYVTHDQIEAMTMATRIGVLDHGRLAQIGTPREIYADPRSIYVATRLGSPLINLLPVGVLPVTAPPTEAKTMGVRTEHINIRPEPSGIGTVMRVEHLGDQSHLHVAVGEHRLVTLVDAHTDLSAGARVTLDLTHPLFFNAAGARVAAPAQPGLSP